MYVQVLLMGQVLVGESGPERQERYCLNEEDKS